MSKVTELISITMPGKSTISTTVHPEIGMVDIKPVMKLYGTLPHIIRDLLLFKNVNLVTSHVGIDTSELYRPLDGKGKVVTYPKAGGGKRYARGPHLVHISLLGVVAGLCRRDFSNEHKPRYLSLSTTPEAQALLTPVLAVMNKYPDAFSSHSVIVRLVSDVVDGLATGLPMDAIKAPAQQLYTYATTVEQKNVKKTGRRVIVDEPVAVAMPAKPSVSARKTSKATSASSKPSVSAQLGVKGPITQSVPPATNLRLLSDADLSRLSDEVAGRLWPKWSENADALAARFMDHTEVNRNKTEESNNTFYNSMFDATAKLAEKAMHDSTKKWIETQNGQATLIKAVEGIAVSLDKVATMLPQAKSEIIAAIKESSSVDTPIRPWRKSAAEASFEEDDNTKGFRQPEKVTV